MGKSCLPVLVCQASLRLGEFNNRKGFSHESGGWKSKIEVSAGLVSSGAFLWLVDGLLRVPVDCLVPVCPNLLPKDTLTEMRAHLMTSVEPHVQIQSHSEVLGFRTSACDPSGERSSAHGALPGGAGRPCFAGNA